MIEIRACAADFAHLVAAENALNRGFRRFAAVLVRRNQIRCHDENAQDAENSAMRTIKGRRWLFPELGP
jgi:hypothetical protein